MLAFPLPTSITAHRAALPQRLIMLKGIRQSVIPRYRIPRLPQPVGLSTRTCYLIATLRTVQRHMRPVTFFLHVCKYFGIRTSLAYHFHTFKIRARQFCRALFPLILLASFATPHHSHKPRKHSHSHHTRTAR
jgi:hypothetical protein